MLGERRAVEQSVQERQESTVRRTIVDRTTDYQTIRLLKLLSNFVDEIIKDTFSFGTALSAGYTSADIFNSHLDQFGLDSFFLEDPDHLLQRSSCTAMRMRTSV